MGDWVEDLICIRALYPKNQTPLPTPKKPIPTNLPQPLYNPLTPIKPNQTQPTATSPKTNRSQPTNQSIIPNPNTLTTLNKPIRSFIHSFIHPLIPPTQRPCPIHFSFSNPRQPHTHNTYLQTILLIIYLFRTKIPTHSVHHDREPPKASDSVSTTSKALGCRVYLFGLESPRLGVDDAAAAW